MPLAMPSWHWCRSAQMYRMLYPAQLLPACLLRCLRCLGEVVLQTAVAKPKRWASKAPI